MKQIKKRICTLLAFCLLFSSMGFCLGMSAPTDRADRSMEVCSSGVSERGLFTLIQIVLEGEDGKITARAINRFTLFPSVVSVYVELYCSDTYQGSFLTMDLVAWDHIDDLDQGHELSVTVPTNGEHKYWCARARYKFDNRDWVEKLTPVYLRNGKGEAITS